MWGWHALALTYHTCLCSHLPSSFDFFPEVLLVSACILHTHFPLLVQLSSSVWLPLQVIGELEEQSQRSLEGVWAKVNTFFARIFSTLLPGAGAKLEPPEGATYREGER